MTRKKLQPPGRPIIRKSTVEGSVRLRRSQNRQTRRHARKRCSEDTHFAANRQLFEGRIKNLSAGGTYIQSKVQFLVGQDIVVAGPFADDHSEMKRRGKVVRLDANGFAVQFLY